MTVTPTLVSKPLFHPPTAPLDGIFRSTESYNDTCRCYITHATLYDNGRHVWMRGNSKLRWKLASVTEEDDNLESSKVAGIGRSDID